jgi:S-formylglutathione hydrolase FrmB
VTPARGALPSIDIWPPCFPRTAPIQLGLTQVGQSSFDPAITYLTLASKAMGSDVHVAVMLPAGYAASPAARYPVLYLLHGALGSYQDWPLHDVEAIVGTMPMIVVMPDDGQDGSYSDWYGSELGSTGPVPAWESFHVQELVPWVDAHYRTIAATRGRYIAGLSSGGGGAMKYASANPGMFAAAGEFSGAVDTDQSGYYGESDVTWDLTYLPNYGPPGHCTWGDPSAHQVVWEDNDPTYEAANLLGTRLYLASGNGTPGPFDSSTTTRDVVESTVWQMNQNFDAALTAAHVPHTTNFYGDGTHNWPYWERDLGQFLVWLAPSLGRAVGPPLKFSVRSARSTFRAWDWTFTAFRRAREFTYLAGVGQSGLTVAGSGALNVVTAALYRPGALYVVGLSRVVAGIDGRLRFSVDLGPSHTSAQTVFGPGAPAGWKVVRVGIGSAPPGSPHQLR